MIGINRFPEGLLALLDLKSRGTTPATLADVVSPTLDMLPYYELGQTLQWFTSTGTLTAGAASAPLVVPPGQVWLVRRATMKVQALAAGVVQAYLAGGPANVVLSTAPMAEMGPGVAGYNFQASSAGSTSIIAFEPKHPMLFRSGWQFNAFTDTLTGGGFTVIVSVLATRYDT